MSSRKADLLILFITLLWGGTFPLIRNSLHYTNANWFVTLRFLLAALIFLPFVFNRLRKTSIELLFISAVLGLLTGFGYYAQTIGLKTIGSAESAFITSMSVILIPLFLPLFKLGRPNIVEGVAVILCLIGAYILTGADLANLSLADFWTFVCAATTALSVVYLQRMSKRIDDFVLCAFYQIVFASIIPLISSIYHHQYHAQWTFDLWKGLLYCAVLATMLTLFIQTRYQQYTSPTKVGIIFTMEPVFASIFAFFFNSELISQVVLIGGAIILISLLLAELKNISFFKSDANLANDKD